MHHVFSRLLKLVQGIQRHEDRYYEEHKGSMHSPGSIYHILYAKLAACVTLCKDLRNQGLLSFVLLVHKLRSLAGDGLDQFIDLLLLMCLLVSIPQRREHKALKPFTGA